jgi:hypothetical protein
MRRPKLVAAALILIGLIGLVIGAFLAPHATLAAYLAGFAFALSLSLGCLILVIVAHATGARWMLVYRRLAELGAVTLFVLLPAFIPILLGARLLYHWAGDPARPWLNLPFFTLRSIGYFAVWIVVAEVLLYFSLHQDPKLARTTVRLRTFAAASIWPIVLTFSFAALDWFMSLDDHWISSMYPVYYFAGTFLATLGLIGLAPRLTSRTMEEINPSHRHSIGKLELTFVIFWAYIAFCQFFLIWMADLPHEIVWYFARMEGIWGVLGVALILGHFAIPFFLLLSRELKRRQVFLTAIGAWLLFIHWIDILWLIVPSADPDAQPASIWLHFSALFFFAGLLLAAAILRGARHPLVPRDDPFFSEALRYRTP